MTIDQYLCGKRRALLYGECNIVVKMWSRAVAQNWLLHLHHLYMMVVWLSGNALALINVVALRRVRLVLGWVTIRRYTILVFNQANQAYSAWPSLCG